MAYKNLGVQVKRWSDFVDFDLPDSGKVRITVTYLSPQLLDVILLNNLFWNDLTNLNQADFFLKITEGLTKITKRNETFFWVTITSSQPANGTSSTNPISIDIPINGMELTNSNNSNNSTALPSHFDHTLNEHLRLIHYNFSGYVSYQLGYKDGDVCRLFLDPAWDTKISLHLTSLKINNEEKGAQAWNIRFSPLIEDGIAPKLDFSLPNPSPIVNAYLPTDSPPNPKPTPPEPDAQYWEQIGLYIWEQVLFANSP